jgi:membrane-bound ClpP family serine protease
LKNCSADRRKAGNSLTGFRRGIYNQIRNRGFELPRMVIAMSTNFIDRTLRGTARCRSLSTAALAGVILLLATLTPRAFADGSADRGYVLNVPSKLTTEWIEQKQKYIDELLNRFEKRRDAQNKGVFKLICDFNPNNQASASQDFYACDKLADYLTSLRNKNVRVIGFVHDEVESHSVLPVLACSEIVVSAKANGPGDKQRVPGFGKVHRDPVNALPEKQQTAYLKLAQGRFSTALIRKMFDPKLVVVKVRDVGPNGERYQDANAKQAPQGELVPGLGPNEVAFYNFDRAKEYGLCQQTPLNQLSDVLTEYGLSRDANLYELPERTIAWRVVVGGELEKPLVESTKRHINTALGEKANLLVIQLECHEGDSQAAMDLAMFLLRLKESTAPVRTIAYVTEQARDTAAFLAFACDEIVMDPAADLNFQNYYDKVLKKDNNREQREKVLRENLMQVARDQGYPEVMARGMLDRQLVIHAVVSAAGESRRKFMSKEELDAELQKPKPEWQSREIVKPLNPNDPDKYLALTPDTAKTFGLLPDDAVVKNEQDLYGRYGLDAKDVKLAKNDWLDAVGDFLRLPMTGVFLVGIGILCLILELKMPGVSLPGVIAAVCFVLFFWAHSQHSTIGVLAILLFVLGLVLIGVEVFLLPGLTAPGIVGVLLIVASIGMAAYGSWPRTADDWVGFGKTLSPFGVSILVAVIGAFIAARYLPSIPFANRLMLKPPGQPAEGEEPEPPAETVRAELAALLGAIGVAATPLRPAGKVQFGEQFVDVVAEGSFVQPGTRVQVVEIEGNRVVVKEV